MGRDVILTGVMAGMPLQWQSPWPVWTAAMAAKWVRGTAIAAAYQPSVVRIPAQMSRLAMARQTKYFQLYYFSILAIGNFILNCSAPL